MQLHTCTKLEYFEERKRLLQELLDSQYAAETALLHSSLGELARINWEQLRICERLCGPAHPSTQYGEVPNQRGAVSMGAQAGVRRASDLKVEIMRLEKEVRYRNRVFSAVLARVRRTMDIFGRASASLGPTYIAKDIRV